MPLSVHPRTTSCVPAGQRRSWHRGEAARALDEESVVAVQGESSEWLKVMPELPQAPQGAGLIALEEDGRKGPFLRRGKGREVGLKVVARGSSVVCAQFLWEPSLGHWAQDTLGEIMKR